MQKRLTMLVYNQKFREILAFWLTLVVLYTSGRIFFFTDFAESNFLQNTDVKEILYVFIMAMRFDISIATILLLPLLGISLIFIFSNALWAHKLFRWAQFWKYWIVVLSATIIVIDHYFYYYYRDHFNIFFWEFWMNWENSRLVIWSIFDELPIGEVLITLALFILGGLVLPKQLEKRLPAFEKWYFFKKRRSVVLWLFFCIVTARGTFGIPLSIPHQTLISSNTYLNTIHTNPFYSLHASWQASIQQSLEIKGELMSELTDVSPSFHTVASWDSRATVAGQDKSLHLEYQVPLMGKTYLKEKPKHVVLIFMEGYGSWFFNTQDTHFNQSMAKNLLQLKEQSIYFDNYFPAGSGTIQNLIKTISGIPTPIGFPVANGFSEAFKPFPSSLARQMEALGYQTRFFYAGNLTWHRLAYFLEKVGFRGIYGANHVVVEKKTRFGVYDGDLFNFVDQKLKNATEPTFNFVMTLSNHPPFDTPETFTIPDRLSLPSNLEYPQDKFSFKKRYGAFAYADHALGQFIKKAKQSSYFEETLFVITADHSISGSINWEEKDQYRLHRIPLLLYSPALLKVAPRTIRDYGSHLDLTATLNSLLLDKPQKITTWGRSLLTPSPTQALYSFFLDCQESICRHLDRTYQLDKHQNMVVCHSKLCRETSEKLLARRDALDLTGLHYFFNFPDKSPN